MSETHTRMGDCLKSKDREIQNLKAQIESLEKSNQWLRDYHNGQCQKLLAVINKLQYESRLEMDN